MCGQVGGGRGEDEDSSLGHLGWVVDRAVPASWFLGTRTPSWPAPQFCSVGGRQEVLPAQGSSLPLCPHPTPKPQESSWLSPGILDVVAGGGWRC